MKHAFTLLELSIVLVIIGLIVGGVVAGQELIRNAELNAVLSEKSQMETSINTFKFKYDTIPGEMRNAGDYWPEIAGAGTYCNLITPNGIIDSGYEVLQYFAVLYSSGLIRVGVPQILQNGTVVDGYHCYSNNMQQSPLHISKKNGIYYSPWNSPDTVSTNILLSSSHGGANINTNGGGFTVSEVMWYETKLDDGMPNTGIVRATRGSNGLGYCTSTNSTTDPAVIYGLAAYGDVPVCRLAMALQ